MSKYYSESESDSEADFSDDAIEHHGVDYRVVKPRAVGGEYYSESESESDDELGGAMHAMRGMHIGKRPQHKRSMSRGRKHEMGGVIFDGYDTQMGGATYKKYRHKSAKGGRSKSKTRSKSKSRKAPCCASCTRKMGGYSVAGGYAVAGGARHKRGMSKAALEKKIRQVESLIEHYTPRR
jgi:hypothetical protein